MKQGIKKYSGSYKSIKCIIINSTLQTIMRIDYLAFMFRTLTKKIQHSGTKDNMVLLLFSKIAIVFCYLNDIIIK